MPKYRANRSAVSAVIPRCLLMMPPMRLAGTRSAVAREFAVQPASASRSRNTSPGLLAVSRKRSFLSVWPVWGWQHHPRRRREIIFPVSLNSRIIGDLPCPITRRRSPFAFGVATIRNATPCLRFARVVIAANAIVGLLADSALVAHKWPPPGGVIKRQTQEGKLTVSDNLCTGTVPPSRA